MIIRRPLSLVLLCLACLAGCNGASEIAREQLDKSPPHGFMTRTLQRGIWTRKYAIFVPYSYHPGTSEKYPVIIFLHGIGEGDGFGEGNLNNLTVGLGPAVARQADKFGFIVIFPQSDGGWGPDSDYTQDLFTALANTEREFPVDKDRVSLTGLSTGGAGTWAIGAKYHDQFAALVPMGSNGSNRDDAANLTHVAVRAYCSFLGDIFAGWNDQGMVNKIKELNPSADAKFTATFTFGHDCWENVYGGDELYSWLAQQRRSGAMAAAPAPAGPTAPLAATPAVRAYQPASPPSMPPAPTPVARPAAVSASEASAAPTPAPNVTPVAPRPAAPSSSGDWVNTPW